MKRLAAGPQRLVSIALMIGVASLVAGCSPAPTLAPGQVPLGLRGGGSTADVADFGPGVPFAWRVIIENTASAAVSIDGYELVGRPPGLEVLSAGLLPTAPSPLGLGPLTEVDSDLQAAVAARPIAGSSFGSAADPGWAKGGWLAFVLRATAIGDYRVSGVVIHYHIDGSSFETTIPATLEVCAGATLSPGDTCPFGSPQPS